MTKTKLTQIANKLWELEQQSEKYPEDENQIMDAMADLVKGCSLEDLLQLDEILCDKHCGTIH